VNDPGELLKWTLAVVGAFGTGVGATLAVLRFMAEQRHVSVRLTASYHEDPNNEPSASMDAALFNQGRRVHIERIRVVVGDFATRTSADKPVWIETGESLRRSYDLGGLLADADQVYDHWENGSQLPRKDIERVAVEFEDGEGHVHAAKPDRESRRRLKSWADTIRRDEARAAKAAENDR
jgi:hypothetical protein